MVCKARFSESGRYLVPADFGTGFPGQYLSRDANGFSWALPPVSPYRVSAVLNAVIPELAAQERGSSIVSLVGTILEFATPGMPLLVTALQESMPPAVNNGMYITCRISAPAEIKLYFMGKITTKTLPYLCTVFL